MSSESKKQTILPELISKPELMAKAIVEATLHFDKPDVIAEVSKGLGDAMKGLEIATLDTRLQERGV